MGEQGGKLKHNFIHKIRKQVKDTTRKQVQKKLMEHAWHLQVHGFLLTLASQEKQDLKWKSPIFQLNAGKLKFMMNASIDTLPTSTRSHLVP